MKLKTLFLVSILLTACATTPSEEVTSQLYTNNTHHSLSALYNDPYSLAIKDILDGTNSLLVFRKGITNGIKKNGPIPETYIKCIHSNIPDTSLYSLFIPLYRAHFDEETAYKMADFFRSEAGIKYSTFLQLQLGEQVDLPKFKMQELEAIKDFKAYSKNIKEPTFNDSLTEELANLTIASAIACNSAKKG